jgi:hypothetical protein
MEMLFVVGLCQDHAIHNLLFELDKEKLILDLPQGGEELSFLFRGKQAGRGLGFTPGADSDFEIGKSF